AAEFLPKFLFRNRPLLPNHVEGVRGKLRMPGTCSGLGRLLGIALANQGVEVWKNRGGDEEVIVLIEKIGFEGRSVTEQSHHQLGRILRPRVSKGVLHR